MARTAVVAGTATAVSNRVSRRQATRWGGEVRGTEPAYEEAPPQQAQQPAPSSDPIDRLNELADLRDRGVLTDAEFAAAKAKVLQG
jgi:hypothetical protein